MLFFKVSSHILIRLKFISVIILAIWTLLAGAPLHATVVSTAVTDLSWTYDPSFIGLTAGGGSSGEVFVLEDSRQHSIGSYGTETTHDNFITRTIPNIGTGTASVSPTSADGIEGFAVNTTAVSQHGAATTDLMTRNVADAIAGDTIYFEWTGESSHVTFGGTYGLATLGLADIPGVEGFTAESYFEVTLNDFLGNELGSFSRGLTQVTGDEGLNIEFNNWEFGSSSFMYQHRKYYMTMFLWSYASTTLTPSQVPGPATITLLCLGLAGIAARRKTKKT